MKTWFKILLVILGAWLFCSMLVDFVAVPAVFQNVSKRFEAGTVGMQVFSKFNTLEIIFGVITFFALFNIRSLLKYSKTFLLLGFVLLSLSFTYKFYITPSITNINLEMRGIEDEQRKSALESRHQFFHELYVKLDGTKMMILLGMIISLIVITNKKEETL